MADQQDRIDFLNQKLEILLRKQESFAKELISLSREIEEVKKTGTAHATQPEKIEMAPEAKSKNADTAINAGQETQAFKEAVQETPTAPKAPPQNVPPRIKEPQGKSNWEKFIGENLINKIGIAITVFGVAIGAKYSIENDLISPMTRIILGYLAGLGLLGFGIKLKPKYENYSAVLVSGALAILYFITFAAYSFYGLFPQGLAFGLMLLFTTFGVVAALNYDKQIIAHIGLVGAYAVPFLLSNDSGKATVLFGYMAIINIGIMVISFKKYWKALYNSAFILTWLIYGSWWAFSHQTGSLFTVASIFLVVFFAIFYATFLAYKLMKSEKFLKSDIVLMLFNSFLFYGFGYGLLSGHATGQHLLGAFTLGNAVIHFGVSTVIFRKKLADRNLFYLISGLVLVFITIAVPVQLDGNWVTLFWAFEAALLFWIGRTKNIPFYEKLSYPLMLLGFFSLTQDWSNTYGSYYGNEGSDFMPLANVHLLSSILFVLAFAFINWVNRYGAPITDGRKQNWLAKIMAFGIPAILLFVLYCAFFLEIGHYIDLLLKDSEIELQGGNGTYPLYDINNGLMDFGSIWKLNYTLLFLGILAFVNIKKLHNRALGLVTLSLQLVMALVFLTAGLLTLSELRFRFLERASSENYDIGLFHIGIRYVALAFFGLLLFSIYRLVRSSFMKVDFKIPFQILLHVAILWVASSELINWLDLAGSGQSYKLGLSILWGVYALLLIGLGIRQTKKYLRIGGIGLFGLTLVKLFFYDIASLGTIAKTIVFVSLGILLLIISFLYNKYKPASDDNGN